MERNMSSEFIPKKLQPFSELFPDINEIEIVVKILNSGGNEVGEKLYSNTYSPVNGVPCGHSICKNGGLSAIDIHSVISKIYKNKELDSCDIIECKGGRYRRVVRYLNKTNNYIEIL